MGKNLYGKELGKHYSQRTDGRYEARAQVNGIKIDIIDRDLKVLKAKFTEALDKANKQVDYKKSSATLNEWFDEWFERYKKPVVKVSSVSTLKRSYKNIFGKIIGEKKISIITADDIQDAINFHQDSGRAVSTVRSALSLLEQCLDRATRNHFIETNPCYGLRVSWECESSRKNSRVLSEKEQVRFLQEAEDSWYKEMFYVMFLTGMRVGEVGGLKWSDVNFNKGYIEINRSLSCDYENGNKKISLNKPKTPNSNRIIPFMGECREMLNAQREKQRTLKKQLGKRWRSTGEFDDLVFTTTMGSPVTRYIAEKETNNIVRSINDREAFDAKLENREPIFFEHAYPHAIRHSFCTRCFERGMEPKVVQKLMGHAHYSTTIDIYTHVTQDLFEDEVGKFGNIMSNDAACEPLTQVAS